MAGFRAKLMRRLPPFLRVRRNFLTVSTLFVGLAAALVIYVTATRPPANPLGDQAELSKKYLREMEVYGGKANVLASDFREWFDGLWHGRSLAFTVAVLSVLLALVIFIALSPLPLREEEPKPPGRSR
ncbi:MAG: hypothetical protein ACHQPI_06365 [Thermoanaerobaculia bacterium]